MEDNRYEKRDESQEYDKSKKHDPYYKYYEEGVIETENSQKGKALILIAVLVIAAALSIFASGYMSSVETYDGTIGKLDESKATVAKMAAGATAMSAGLTVLPGDVATPIADKLADLSGYFIFIYSAIYVEKYLTTTSGLMSFRFLIPIALLLILISVFRSENDTFKRIRLIGRNLLVFALVLWMVVPLSVMISNNIQKTFDDAFQQELSEVETNNDSDKVSGDDNVVQKILDGAKEKTLEQTEKYQVYLNNMLDRIAVMIVTTCVIPIGVLIFMLWVVKMLFGINLKLPSIRHKGSMVRQSFKEWKDDLED